VQYGIYVSSCGDYASVHDLVDLAQRAEAAGWDGFFMWDILTAAGAPVVDPQITLAAVAASTTTIRLGAMVTPLGRRRPWKVAREIAALAELSRDRLVFGCSAGSGDDFAPFPGEVQTAAERVACFIDAVEVIRQILAGGPVTWTQSEETARALGQRPVSIATAPFLPAPAVPVPFWGGASVQRERPQRVGPFRRAAQMLDGLFPLGAPFDSRQPITIGEFARAVDYAFEGASPPAGFDVVACGHTLYNHATAADTARFEAEGATWWLETFPDDGPPAQMRALLKAGPPRL
jgi:alkanesulfonate monooxygenase SsuD/methylene tetrahydromethanopterin reductase-like flavin-dependent oxidoreductase (luciferase family)